MRVLIVYASTEGHTRKLAGFAGTRLSAAGHQVRVCEAAESDCPAPSAFEAAFLMGSVHLGRYQRKLARFARRNRDALNAMPSAFVSVSLSAAGDDARDWEGLHEAVTHFLNATGWRPCAVNHAGGAMEFSTYGFLKKLAIRFIARDHGWMVKTTQDYDLTDYAALGRFLDDFVMRAAPPETLLAAQ